MEIITLDQLRYPVGKFSFNKDAGQKEIDQWISEIEQTPASLKNAVKGLSDAQLNTPYRDGGWTLRQVVHHLADRNNERFLEGDVADGQTRGEDGGFRDPLLKAHDIGD